MPTRTTTSPRCPGTLDPTIFPTAILVWSIGLGVGESAGILPLVGWWLTMAALVAFSLRRMERMEL